MGQYYRGAVLGITANKRKKFIVKQAFCPYRYDNGAKLMEHSYVGNYYVKMYEHALANDFDGVESSFALQAGREVRVVVQPEKITEAKAQLLSRDICNRIEKEMKYPGQIKVTIIRETRAVEYAK